MIYDAALYALVWQRAAPLVQVPRQVDQRSLAQAPTTFAADTHPIPVRFTTSSRLAPAWQPCIPLADTLRPFSPPSPSALVS